MLATYTAETNAARLVGLLSVALGLMVLVPARVGAQTTGPSAKTHPDDRQTSTVWGYVIGGPSTLSETYTVSTGRFIGPETPYEVRRRTEASRHFAGGVEWQLFRGFGIGGEAGVRAGDEYAVWNVLGEWRVSPCAFHPS